jgi:hypothetical protein
MTDLIDQKFDLFGYPDSFIILFEIFDYPNDILIEIVSKWIVLEDVCSLDTAYCNKFRREHLTELLKHIGFTQSGIECENDPEKSLWFFDWVFSRNIKLYQIYLHVDNYEDFGLLCELDLSLTTRIKLFQYSPPDGNLANLINLCVRLEQLVLQYCRVSDYMIQSLPRLHQLKYLKIDSTSLDFTMDSISTLAASCTSLEKLCLIFYDFNGESINMDTNETLLELFKRNHNLRSIEVDLINSNPLSNNTNLSLVSDMVGHCQYLKKCDFKWYGPFNISHLSSFLKFYCCIESFSLVVEDPRPDFDPVLSKYIYSKQNDSKRLKIVDHSGDLLCLFDYHAFTEIDLVCTRPVTDITISRIAQKSRNQLLKLTLDNCGDQFSNDSILDLLNSCKELSMLCLIHCDHLNFKTLASKFQKIYQQRTSH